MINEWLQQLLNIFLIFGYDTGLTCTYVKFQVSTIMYFTPSDKNYDVFCGFQDTDIFFLFLEYFIMTKHIVTISMRLKTI